MAPLRAIIRHVIVRDNRAALGYYTVVVGVFDKLEDFIRDIVDQNETPAGGSSDPDFADAWAELDEYMSFGAGRETHGPYRRQTARGEGRGGTRRTGASRPNRIPKELHEHFRNLELEFGASLEQVQLAYKQLIRRYHPDRFATSPGKQRTANEIIKRINDSYHQIVTFYRSTDQT